MKIKTNIESNTTEISQGIGNKYAHKVGEMFTRTYYGVDVKKNLRKFNFDYTQYRRTL